VSPDTGTLPFVIIISHTNGVGAESSSPVVGQQALTQCLTTTLGVVVGVTVGVDEIVLVGVGVGILHSSQLEYPVNVKLA
jgi:hypothetical protein